MIVISDTTPIISLLKIGRLDLLNLLFQNVIIPQAVYNELINNPLFNEEIEVIKNTTYIKPVNVSDSHSVNLLQRATGLDLGESEAIVLSDTEKADILLMDEAKGRKVAKQMGLKVMGTIGMLMTAFDKNIISKEDVNNYIKIMKQEERHISDNLYRQLMEYIGDKD